jgi:hypothetical protein
MRGVRLKRALWVSCGIYGLLHTLSCINVQSDQAVHRARRARPEL